MAGQGRGVVLRLEALFNRFVMRRELTGLDEFGNKYFKKEDTNQDGYPIERRYMKTPRGDYDPDMVPPEWKSWLNKVRDGPPSLEEVARARSARAKMRERALALDAEDAKRRFQAETIGQGRERADREPNMGRFLDQLSPQGDGKAQGGQGARQEGSSQSQQTSSDFKPDVWKPGGS